MWTCYDIEVLIWHHCRVGPFEGHEAPAYPDSIAKLMSHGLVKVTDDPDHPYRATLLGEGLLSLWKETPVPVVKFVDPRYEPISGMMANAR